MRTGHRPRKGQESEETPTRDGVLGDDLRGVGKYTPKTVKPKNPQKIPASERIAKEVKNMSEAEKGAILSQVHDLPPLQKARALGFMQGLAAASADQAEKDSANQDNGQKNSC